MTSAQRAILNCVACALSACVAVGASAQANGIDLGEFRLHASLQLDTGYDTNVYYQDTDEDPTSSLRLNIAPGLSIETENPRNVDLEGALTTTWEQYLLDSSAPTDQSGLDVAAELGVRFNANGLVSVRPSDELRRTNDAAADEAGEPLRLTQNRAELEIGFHPGGANRTDRLGFSGALFARHQLWRYDFQSSSDRNSIGGGGRALYNFLPKTAVFLEAAIDRITHVEAETIVLQDSGTGIPNSDSTPYRVSTGLTGLLARQFGLLARIGYGDANYDEGPSTGALLAQVELSLYPNSMSEVFAGYQRDFNDAIYGNFLTYHRVYVGGELSGRLLTLGLDGFLQFNDYSDLGDAEVSTGLTAAELFGTSSREDTVVGATVGLDFHVTSFFDVGTRYEFESRDSNISYAFPGAASATTTNASASYGRHGVFLVLRLHY